MLRHGHSLKGYTRRPARVSKYKLPAVELVTHGQVDARPGFCARCGIIKLSALDHRLCYDCHIEAAVELAKAYR